VIGVVQPPSSRSRIIERGLDSPEPPAMKTIGAGEDLRTKKRP
jgi:hypothetical protein